MPGHPPLRRHFMRCGQRALPCPVSHCIDLLFADPVIWCLWQPPPVSETHCVLPNSTPTAPSGLENSLHRWRYFLRSPSAKLARAVEASGLRAGPWLPSACRARGTGTRSICSQSPLSVAAPEGFQRTLASLAGRRSSCAHTPPWPSSSVHLTHRPSYHST